MKIGFSILLGFFLKAARKRGFVSLKHGGDKARGEKREKREKSQSTTEYFMYEKSASLSYLSFKILPIQKNDKKTLLTIFTCSTMLQ